MSRLDSALSVLAFARGIIAFYTDIDFAIKLYNIRNIIVGRSMSNIGCLLGTFSWIMNLSVKYKRINSEPERKSKTVYFGVYSIITTVAVGALFILLMWGIFALSDSTGGALSDMVVYALIVLMAICELVLFINLISGGLFGVIYQLRCNRRPIGWIALAVFIIALVGMVVGIILIADSSDLADIL